MGDLEAFARQAFQEITSNGLARGIADGVNKTIQLGPGGRQVGEQLVNLLVTAHIAIKNQFRVKVGRKLGDAVLEALAHITESQLGTLGVAGLGNAVSDRAAGQHAGDQELFARKKSCFCGHVFNFWKMWAELSHA